MSHSRMSGVNQIGKRLSTPMNYLKKLVIVLR